jgi:Restriction alleviation protein Lar
VSDELKPCPFCGNPVEPEPPNPQDPDSSWFVACNNLSCVQPWDAEDTRERLAKSWNRRSLGPQTQAVIDQVAGLLTDPNVGPLTDGVKHVMIDVDQVPFLKEQGIP